VSFLSASEVSAVLVAEEDIVAGGEAGLSTTTVVVVRREGWDEPPQVEHVRPAGRTPLQEERSLIRVGIRIRS